MGKFKELYQICKSAPSRSIAVSRMFWHLLRHSEQEILPSMIWQMANRIVNQTNVHITKRNRNL